MVLVLASRFDEVAVQAVARWPGQGAVLLTVADLSTEGWHIRHGDFPASTLVAGGRRFGVGDIEGVVTLVSFVADHELFNVEPSHRRYAAGEMTAFLFYVLSALPCPVVNPPSAFNLAGMHWRREQWVMACRKVALPVSPSLLASPFGYERAAGEAAAGGASSRPAAAGLGPGAGSVRVLAGRVVASDLPRLEAKVLQLAKLAGNVFLEASFTDTDGRLSVSHLSCMPNLGDPPVFDALCGHFHHD